MVPQNHLNDSNFFAASWQKAVLLFTQRLAAKQVWAKMKVFKGKNSTNGYSAYWNWPRAGRPASGIVNIDTQNTERGM